MTTPTRPDQVTLHCSADAAGVQVEDRTIRGLALPYGEIGQTALGPIRFSQGSVAIPERIGRVKFLRQHDHNVSLGYATEIVDEPAGLRAAALVADGEQGDLALAEAKDGRRDGLSVGVQLSTDTLNELWDKLLAGDDSPTDATGELIEFSQVSIPAFPSARIDGSMAAALGGSAVLVAAFGAPQTPAPGAGSTTTKEQTMTETTVSAAAPAQAEVPPPAAPAPNPTAVVQVEAEAPVYTLDGRGHSFARDAFHARFDGDSEAAGRLAKFNAMMRDTGGRAAAQTALLVAAVETRTTAPNFIQQGYKPELLISAIDKGRPLVSRLYVSTLSDATPYRLPAEGEFHKDTVVTDAATTSGSKTVTSATAAFTSDDVGVPVTGAGIPAGSVIAKINSGTSVNISQNATATATGVSLTIARAGVQDHTEGQAHAAEGDLDVSDVTINPGAVSGAFRLSRELIDASNPALDGVALRAMLRSYRFKTEAKVVAALAAASPTPTATQNTVAKIRAGLNSFYDVMDEPATFFALSAGYYTTLLGDVDTTGRPMLPSVGPVNAVGTASPGWTGANVDGVEFVKSGRIPADVGYYVKADDVHVAESGVQTFRFDEVEGPGVVKLALFGYFVAKVLRSSSVQAVTSV